MSAGSGSMALRAILACILVGFAGAVAAQDTPSAGEALSRASEADLAFALDASRREALAPLLAQIQRRIAEAKAGGAAADRIAALADLEDQYAVYLRGGLLPGFMRAAPPVFAAKPARQKTLRFVAFGDFGDELESQRKVAEAMRAEHRKRRFDMGITLGDNFYDVGAESPDNPRWVTQWEQMYSPLKIPFYASLGNHDWYHPDSAAAEILYTQRGKSWRMPAAYYSYTAGPVQFFVVDTGDGEDGLLTEKQLLWLQHGLAASTARWKVVYGHHPVFAGSREDSRAYADQMMPVLRAGKVDAFLAGHDHVLAHLKAEDGIQFFIAGGGGSEAYEMRKDNPRQLFGESVHGFLVVDAGPDEMLFRFIDDGGREVYRYAAR